MKLRITGTREECAAAVEAMIGVFLVREVSDFYLNRGVTTLGRVYLDVEAPPDRLRAAAERADRKELPTKRGGEG